MGGGGINASKPINDLDIEQVYSYDGMCQLV